MDMIMGPLRMAGSKPARRAYLTTFLLASGSLFLLFLSVFTYILFYINYIPQIGLLQPVYLQYSSNQPPTAYLTLPATAMIPHQPYTVTVHLRLPSSPSNMHTGNFMLHLTLLSATNKTLASSRRPAIMTYRSPLLERIDTLLRAPLFVSGWQRQEEFLSVVLLEDVILPSSVRSASVSVDTPSAPPAAALGVYDVAVEFRARFTGVRWLMHNYRITTFLFATALFWGIEVVFMTIVWWVVYSQFAAGVGKESVEGEESDEEDDERRTGYPSPSPTPGPEEEGRAAEELYADDEVSSSEEEVVVDVGDSGLGSTSESAGSTARPKAPGMGVQRRRPGVVGI